MAKRVDILSKQDLLGYAFFRVQEIRFQHEKYDGSLSPEIKRLNLERGDSVAAVVHDTVNQTLLFTEQFRICTYEKGPGWLLEVPAGTIEAGETPQECLYREIEEEIGYTIHESQVISTFYVSPGGTSERIHLYYVSVTPEQQTSAGGGVIGEHEHIRLVALPLADAFASIASGLIQDAKTIIGLLWMQQHIAS